MSIVSEIMRIEQAKANLKDNLNSVLNDNQIPDSATLDQYTEYISLLKKQKPYQDATTIAPTTISQTITAKDGYNLSSVNIAAVVPSDYYKDETQLSITPSLYYQNFSSTDNIAYNQIVVEAVTESIDSNCKPENIKVGITILGITGTCSLPTLYPPTIELSGTTLSIDDKNNGDFSSGYNLYFNGVKKNSSLITSLDIDLNSYGFTTTDIVTVTAAGDLFNESEHSNTAKTPTATITYSITNGYTWSLYDNLTKTGTTLSNSGEIAVGIGSSLSPSWGVSGCSATVNGVDTFFYYLSGYDYLEVTGSGTITINNNSINSDVIRFVDG